MPRPGGEEDRLPSVVYGHPRAAISIASCFSLTPAPSRGTPLLSQAARPATPGVAQPGAQPHGLSRLAAEILLTPGRWNDPCGTCPPSSPLLWAGRPLTSSHRRDRPAPSPAISRTTRNPEPIRAPRSRHSPTLSRHQNTGPPLSKKNHSLHNGTISLAGTAYLVSRSRAGQEALITWDAHRITITDPHGEVLTQYPWPQPGTRYVSHHDPATRATRGGRPRKTPRNVTDVLTHQPSPMS